MFDIERQNEIKELLKEEKSISVNELAKALYVSGATVRRDLNEMQKLGLIERTHGGAILKQTTYDESAFFARELISTQEKKIIAGLVTPLLKSNSVIFMDSSSSTGFLTPLLGMFSKLTVVTNGIKTALELSKLQNVSVFVTGGHIESFSNSILGATTTNFLSTIFVDTAVISCSGITENGEITDSNAEQSNIKKLLRSKAKTVIVLADNGKFGETFMNSTFTLADIDYLVTNKTPPQKLLALAEQNYCKVIFP